MNPPTIITGLTPLQAMELLCIGYCADYLPVLDPTHRRSQATITPSIRHRCWTCTVTGDLTNQHMIHSSGSHATPIAA